MLIDKNQQKKYLKFRNKKRSIIIINIKNKKVFGLSFKKLRFEKILKVVKKYSKVENSLVYTNCLGINYNYLIKYKDKIT